MKAAETPSCDHCTSLSGGLSDSPPERDVQWSQEGVSAAYKFIQKLWKLNNEIFNKKNSDNSDDDLALEKAVNKTIYNVTKNLENFQYNVVIANIHEIYNLFNQYIVNNQISSKKLKNEWEKINMLLLPIVPHLAHECLEKINKNFYWPKHNSKLLEEKECKIVIQIDGKKRGILEMPINSQEKTIIERSKKLDNISRYLKGSTIIKNIYVKNRLINFIIKK